MADDAGASHPDNHVVWWCVLKQGHVHSAVTPLKALAPKSDSKGFDFEAAIADCSTQGSFFMIFDPTKPRPNHAIPKKALAKTLPLDPAGKERTQHNSVPRETLCVIVSF